MVRFRPFSISPVPVTIAQRQTAALAWLDRSFRATGGGGSAHSYSPLFGWAKAYPETTGYLIDTLFDYAARRKNEALARQAFCSADWLCSLQFPSGAFPALLAGSRSPSIFNTTQILFGLTRAMEESAARTSSDPSGAGEGAAGPAAGTYRQAIHNALDWLLELQESDGSWRRAAYVPGYTPSYYTRAVWGILRADREGMQVEIREAMRKALHFYARRYLPSGAVADWGFYPGQAAFTHTIAYTLEGFWESALLLEEPSVLERTLRAAEKLLEIRAAAGHTAGRYDDRWRGDYSFICLPGNAQLSVLYRRIGQITGREEFYRAAGLFLQEILPYQAMGTNGKTHGGLPGSAPFWGPYLRGRYPNWGVKFLLDALY